MKIISYSCELCFLPALSLTDEDCAMTESSRRATKRLLLKLFSSKFRLQPLLRVYTFVSWWFKLFKWSLTTYWKHRKWAFSFFLCLLREEAHGARWAVFFKSCCDIRSYSCCRCIVGLADGGGGGVHFSVRPGLEEAAPDPRQKRAFFAGRSSLYKLRQR